MSIIRQNIQSLSDPQHKSVQGASFMVAPKPERKWPSYQSSPSINFSDQMLAAAKNNLSMEVWRLIKVHNVSPDFCNHAGQTALHIAALWGHVDCVALLVSRDIGANPNVQNHITGATPLHLAIEGRKIREATRLSLIVDVLLEAGADKSMADNTGRLPIDCITPSTPGYQQLIPKLHVLLPMPSMFRAIQQGDLTHILQLFYVGKSSPQHLACQVYCNRTTVQAVVDLMVTSVADAFAPVEVWMQADLDALKILLQCGASPSSLPEPRRKTFNPSELSELMGESEASEDANIPSTSPVIRLLDRIQQALCPSKSIEDRNKASNNELSSGDGLQLPPIVRLWLEACQALQERHQEDIVLFWQCGKNKPTPLLTRDEVCQYWHNSARRGHLLMLRALNFYLPNLFEANALNRQSMTALHFAARSGKTDIIQFYWDCPILMSPKGIAME
ncbi:ankyrin repeat domain protein [Nitzschia inconspicua]|uniref:Ankyrin repeat domain protein n=1 Tax=Nitzschia inconspicua TaxID=303405 RepID=A0A9K3M228_9STRA|nr:ankyrin repeat domain protein [Nitzschia inconspicua]